MRRRIPILIETPRLRLRPPEARDLDGWASLFSDPESARYVGGPNSRAESWRKLAVEAGSWELYGFGVYSVVERGTGRWIGRIGAHFPEGYPGLEFGWGLLRSHWGQGLALEAASAALGEVFVHLGCEEIIHLIDPENLRSVRLAERLGARRGGKQELPPPYDRMKTEAWVQNRAEWVKRSNAASSFGRTPGIPWDKAQQAGREAEG